MDWVYLSPHVDDAVFSCGGLIWQQVQAGERVEVWTIFAGDAPGSPLSPYASTLHERWQTGLEAPAARRAEDLQACARLGAVPRHFSYAECIYRFLPGGEPVVRSRDDLFQPVQEGELPVVMEIAALLSAQIPADTAIVCPLTAGGHLDHRLARAAAETTGRPLWYYPDYPYTVLEEFAFRLEDWVAPEWQSLTQAISDKGLRAWQDAVGEYTSQVSSFWPDDESMRAALKDYRDQGGGSVLYHPPEGIV